MEHFPFHLTFQTDILVSYLPTSFSYTNCKLLFLIASLAFINVLQENLPVAWLFQMWSRAGTELGWKRHKDFLKYGKVSVLLKPFYTLCLFADWTSPSHFSMTDAGLGGIIIEEFNFLFFLSRNSPAAHGGRAEEQWFPCSLWSPSCLGWQCVKNLPASVSAHEILIFPFLPLFCWGGRLAAAQSQPTTPSLSSLPWQNV